MLNKYTQSAMHLLFQAESQIFRNTQMNLSATLLVLLAGGNSWAL